MSANSRFAVTIHILTLLALKQQPLTSKHIACSVNTNPVVVRRLLSLLAKAGLIHTQLGVEGGSTLAHPPHHITLHQIYHLIHPNHLFALHPNQPDPHCPCGRNIQPILNNIFQQTETAIATVLTNTTLADIVNHLETNSPNAASPPPTPRGGGAGEN